MLCRQPETDFEAHCLRKFRVNLKVTALSRAPNCRLVVALPKLERIILALEDVWLCICQPEQSVLSLASGVCESESAQVGAMHILFY